jgi:CRP/FNR family transcriptional regulator
MLGKSVFDVDTITAHKQPVARAEGPLSPCPACKVRDVVVCGSLDDAELPAISSIKSVVDLERGAPLFHAGEPAEHVFNVTGGVIRVYKLLADGRRQITGFLFPGDFLGIANDFAYAYGAEAVTYASVCRFKRRDIEALLARFPKLEHRLLRIASHELAAAQEQMMLLGRKTARERVASFLVMLSQRAASRGLPDNPIPLPMSRGDMGDYLGLSMETVSRTISGLRRHALIADTPDGGVEILDREQLNEISGVW